MLLFDTLIQYLNISQKQIINLYNNVDEEIENVFVKYIDKNEKDTINLPEVVLNLHNDFKDYYYIKLKLDNNSFLYSMMSILDKNFTYCLEKKIYLSDLRKKLCYDLDEKNLYRIFNYVGKRNMKKDIIQQNLLDINKELNEMSEKYISDYFGINIFIFVIENNNLNDTKFILSTNDTDVGTLYKPTIFLLKIDGYYKPIFNKNENHILLYNDIIVDIYPLKIDNHKVDEHKLPSLKKILIKNLQKICEDNSIDIYKDKNGKKVCKTKNELYDELKLKMI